MIRAFIAIDVPGELKDRICAYIGGLGRFDSVRTVDKESIHITLHFFKSLSERETEGVINALGGLDESRFEVSLGAVDFFGGSRPSVIFVKVARGRDEIKSIYARLYKVLSHSGISLESREFTPHLTIGRVRGYQKGLDEKLRDFALSHAGEIGTFTCDRIVLKRSDFVSGKAVHTELYAVALKG